MKLEYNTYVKVTKCLSHKFKIISVILWIKYLKLKNLKTKSCRSNIKNFNLNLLEDCGNLFIASLDI